MPMGMLKRHEEKGGISRDNHGLPDRGGARPRGTERDRTRSCSCLGLLLSRQRAGQRSGIISLRPSLLYGTVLYNDHDDARLKPLKIADVAWPMPAIIADPTQFAPSPAQEGVAQ
jgi:hypothetical protein